MKLVIVLLFVSMFFNKSFSREWSSDILGNDYINATILLPDDYSGKIKATIIKKKRLKIIENPYFIFMATMIIFFNRN